MNYLCTKNNSHRRKLYIFCIILKLLLCRHFSCLLYLLLCFGTLQGFFFLHLNVIYSFKLDFFLLLCARIASCRNVIKNPQKAALQVLDLDVRFRCISSSVEQAASQLQQVLRSLTSSLKLLIFILHNLDPHILNHETVLLTKTKLPKLKL